MCIHLIIYCTVQLKGNIALAVYLTLDPRQLNTLYPHSNTHSISKGRVANHLKRAFTYLSIIYRFLLKSRIGTHRLELIHPQVAGIG